MCALLYPTVRGSSKRLMSRIRIGLAMLGIALLVAAWIAGTQPFGAPDEASHYVRALSITNGQLLGRKVPYNAVPLTPTQQVWANQITRAVRVPARLSPPNIQCYDHKPDIRGSCTEATGAGVYPPLSYLLPAVGLGVSNRTSTAIWVTRGASALPSIAFLLLAVALLWDGTGWSVLGLFAAISPMVLWDSSILNPSGLQITACVALAAALIRIARAPANVPRWVWVALIVSGVAAILAGPIGLEFVIIYAVLLGALFGRSRLRQVWRTAQRWALPATALAFVGAGLAAIIYSHVAGLSATFRISPLVYGLHQGAIVFVPVLKGVVGIFGGLTIFLPLWAYWTWWLIVLALVATAMWLGDRRDRVLVSTVTILALAFPIVFYAWVERFTGYWLQGREVLPILLLIPLVAGEVINRRRAVIADRRPAQLVLGSAMFLMAAFQGYAWWQDARSVAGAPHTTRFYAYATWTPPGGWLPWVAAAVLGTVALLLFATTEGLAGVRLQTARGTPRRDRVAA